MELFEKTLGEFLEEWAEKTPEKEYIVYSDRDLRFTYKEFNERVDKLAKGLLAIGIKKGSHVGIWATNVPDWSTLFFATAKIGAILVTINTNYKQHELEYIVEHADLQTICISDGTFESDFPEMIYKMCPELKSSERGFVQSTKFPFLRNVIYIGQEKKRGMYNMPELFLLGSALKKGIYENAKKQVSCYDICNIQYTSGTTGFPKGVMLTHYGITNNAYCIGERMRYSDHTVLCIPVPLFHCFGIVLGLICMIVYGGICVIIETFDAFAVLSSIHKEKCTSIYGVPTMYLAELNHPLFKKFNMSSLRTGVMAGSVCPQWLMEEVMDKMYMKDITICYGLTEVSPVMTQTDADDTVEVKVTTVGHELPHIEVKVLDPETLEECAVGEEGEMCCRGYNIMKGYYKDPEATNLMIDKNGFLHSGDLGTKGIDGNYRITGRIKDMIIRGGENIYPAEIEAYLYNMPEIEAVEVIAVPSRKYGEEVGAFIILKKDKYLEADDIKNFCKGNISRYKIPKYIFFVDQYPLTASGKIQKYKLRDLAVDMLQKEGVALD